MSKWLYRCNACNGTGCDECGGIGSFTSSTLIAQDGGFWTIEDVTPVVRDPDSWAAVAAKGRL